MGEELAALSPYHSQLNVGPPESCQSSGEFLHSPFGTLVTTVVVVVSLTVDITVGMFDGDSNITDSLIVGCCDTVGISLIGAGLGSSDTSLSPPPQIQQA